MRKFIVIKPDEQQLVLLMEHREEEYFSYVNISRGHICPCKFETEKEAIKDMENQMKSGKILGFMEIRI